MGYDVTLVEVLTIPPSTQDMRLALFPTFPACRNRYLLASLQNARE